MIALGVVGAIEPLRMRADLFTNLWILIIVVYVIASFIAGVLRSFRRLKGGDAGTRMTPTQRYAEAQQQEVTAARRQAASAGATVARRSMPVPAPPSSQSQAPSTPIRSDQPVRQELVDVLAQMLKSGQPIETLAPVVAPAPASAALPSQLPQRPADFLSAAQPVVPILASQPSASGLAPDVAALVARLATPSGLAFAIVAAAIVGTPQALRTEPQHPGGW